MKKEITVKEIFDANQILTIAVARTLIGKRIATTNEEYSGNVVDVRVGAILDIKSEWDLASMQNHSHLDGGKWATRQDYWKSYMSEKQIKDKQNRLKLLSGGSSTIYGTCEDGKVFFGSDSDRLIYYIVL